MRLSRIFSNTVNRKKLLLITSLIAALLVSYTLYQLSGYAVVSVASGLIISFAIFRKILSPTLFQSKALVSITSLVAYVGILQMTLYITWSIVNESTLLTAPFILQIILSIGLIAISSKKSPTLPVIKLVDIAALAATVLFVGALSIMQFRHAENTGGSNAITFVNVSTDDAAHISILNDRLQHKKAVITEAVEHHTSRHSATSYPAGWHNTNAVFILSVVPSIETGYDSIVAYIVSKLFWVAILIYLAGAAAASLIVQSGRKWLVAYWVFLSSLLVAVWFIADSMEVGFYNYIGIFITIPLSVLAMAQLAAARDLQSSLWSLILPISLAAIIALSWLLVAPILIATTILLFIRSLLFKDLWKDLRNPKTWTPLIFVIALTVMIIFSFLVQLQLTQTGTERLGFIGTLLIPGGISIYPTSFYLTLLVGCIPFASILLRSNKKDSLYATLETTILYLVIALGFTAFIYVIQLYYAQQLSYYFYKTLYISIFMIMLIVISGTARFISKSSAPPLLVMSIITIGILGSAMTMYPEPRFVNYARNNHHTTPAVSKLIEEKLRTTYSQDAYLNNNVDLAITPDNYHVIPEIFTYLLQTNKPHSDCYRQAFLLSANTPSDTITPTNISDLPCNNYIVTVYVDNPNLEYVQQAITESGKQNFTAKPLPQS